jgi:hypothetical protein
VGKRAIHIAKDRVLNINKVQARNRTRFRQGTAKRTKRKAKASKAFAFPLALFSG